MLKSKHSSKDRTGLQYPMPVQKTFFKRIVHNVFKRKILEEAAKLIQRSKQGPLDY